MTLYEELYFEITLNGTKGDVKRLVSFLESGGLDDFFEYSPEYIDYGDDYSDASDAADVTVTFTNDDFGIEIEELDTDDFLETFCKAARNLDARGRLSDIDDEEYSFVSSKGDSYYLNADKIHLFNDELDAQARAEEDEEDEEN